MAEDGGSAMGLRKLKDYGLTFKGLKADCVALNEAELADAVSVKVGVKGDDMLENFLNAIDSIQKKKVKDIPEEVRSFYDDLSQGVFDDSEDTPEEVEEEAEVEKEVEEEAEVEKEVEGEVEESKDDVTSDCPTFKTGWDKEEKDCQDCEEEYPEEYKVCKKATKDKKKEDKDKEKGGTKKAKGKRTRYGHVAGSMNEDIDNMLWKGAKRPAIVKVLIKKHGRSDRLAGNKVTGHIAHLKANRGVVVTEDKKGVLKADKEFAPGYNKENTITK